MPVGPVARDAATKEFFEGTSRGEFLLRHCTACGAVSAPQAQQCQTCNSTDLGWEPASGLATLVSWTATHTRATAAVPATRTVLAVAELAEGPWWWSQLLDVGDREVHSGMPLTIDYERSGDYEALPVFRLA